ncbi:MAG TPA: P-loop NTPase fold protein [Candidatus Rubrimentiphilum sp.]|nr:P-loop NTPase fold protein [Candidatus Rubrimentiphilum sp.]
MDRNDTPNAMAQVVSEAATSFNPDKPIEKFDQDRLGRRGFAKALGRVLANYDQEESLVLGLYGEWGIGKTSLLNLALQAAKDFSPLSPIVVRFNPWYFSDRENLLRQFFEALSIAIDHQGAAKTYSRAASLLGKLSKGIDSIANLPVPGADAAHAIGSFLGIAGKNVQAIAERAGSLDYVKNEISQALAVGRRRVIVIIDDIDRLTAQEMQTVFQVVKALGDFKYTTYLLAFDDTVVTRALDGVQNGNGAAYLEKIVNVVRNIPPITQVRAGSLMVEALNEFAAGHPLQEWSHPGRDVPLVAYLSKSCRTMRHLHRFVNALNTDISSIDGEIDGTDFLAITAIRLQHPTVYAFIRDNRDFFIETDRAIIDKDGSDRLAKPAIEEVCKAANGPNELQDLLVAIFPRLSRIFDKHHHVGDGERVEWRRDRRVCDVKSFDTYFQFEVDDVDISKSRMEDILNHLDEALLRSTVLSFIDERIDKGIAFLERLQDHLDDRRVLSHAQDIVTVLFDTGDRFPQDLRGFPFRLDGGTLIMQIVYHLLRRVDREQTRYEIFIRALSSANESLEPLVTAVSTEDSMHGRFGSSGKAQRIEEQLVIDSNLDILEDAARKKIEEWAAGEGGGRLATHDRLPYVLYRWAEWRDRQTVEDYILTRLDPANFARLIITLAEERGSIMKSMKLDREEIRKLVEPEKALSRLRNILSGPERESIRADRLEALETLSVEGFRKESAGDTSANGIG